nr:putative RNA-directed DNA polymerase, eukaryota, reverse transcriptase zinc-binding domain protein [Tanacetum cinerariifolium]
MECVTSTSFSLSINGSLHGYFKGKRGLRQGDPLSPYLFTLVMEVFTLMLRRKVRQSDTFKYHRYCADLDILNLCFADDHFIFAYGDPNSARVIMHAMEEFRNTSGLIPSLAKSTVYFCNVVHHTKMDILQILPFEEGRLPVNGKAKVSWEVVCLPKMEGGLGIRRLDIFNKALMVPHIWNLLTRKDSLWVKWIHVYRLKDVVSNRELHRAGFTHSSTVKEAISNGSWSWPGEWFTKHAFHLWLVAKHRLLTQDRLRSWDVAGGLASVGCPLCDGQPDSHDHLFFQCSFSTQVWKSLRDSAGLNQVSNSIVDIVNVLIPIAKSRTIRSVVAKLVVAACAYHIWEERNYRLFQSKKISHMQVSDKTKSIVRLKLLSCSFKKSKAAYWLQRQWDLPDSIFR